MPGRKLPDNQVLLTWLAQGKTHEQIQRLVKDTTGNDVTRAAVSVAIHRLGATGRRPTYGEWLPWTVSIVHTKDYPAVMLRAYARYVAADRDPNKLPADLRTRLFNWLAMLEEKNQVVDYNQTDGFRYVRARAGEEVIRRPGPTPPRQRTAINE